jgi:hypothetical protein
MINNGVNYFNSPFFVMVRYGYGMKHPVAGLPRESFRPYSRSPRVVSSSFINSALKKMKYKKYHCKYSYFGWTQGANGIRGETTRYQV